jgi:serine/threonine protein kinase
MPLHHEINREGSVARPTGVSGGEYIIKENNILGKGATSIVKLAKHSKTHEIAAVKIVNLALHSKYFDHELKALSLLNHKNIVKLFHYDKSNGYLFLEYVPFPSLYDHVQNCGRLSESVALKLLHQMVDAFQYMHSLAISHQDFKPENVCYDPISQEIIIIDFGLSLFNDEEAQLNGIGSPLYMAPEIHQRQPYDRYKADIWSIGICFYEILTGDTPFVDCIDIDDLLDRLLFENSPIPIPDYVSSGASFLLKRMLNRDPNERLDMDGIMDLLLSRTASS